MSHNPEIASQEKEPETDRSAWKIALLGLFGVASSAATVSEFLNFSTTFRASYFWISIIAALFFLSFAVLQAFFIKGSWKLLLITFLEVAVPLLVFRSHFDATTLPFLLAALVSGILFMELALERGRKILRNSIEPNFFPIAKSIIPKLITGFLIFLSILLYLNYFAWGNFNDTLGKTITTDVLSSAAPVVKLWIPNISFDSSVHTFLSSLAADQLQRTSFTVVDSGGASHTFLWNNLPKKQQDEYLNQAITQVTAGFTKEFGEVDQNESMNEFVYGALKGYLQKIGGTAGTLLPVTAILLFFFVMKGIAALLYWFVAFFAFVFFKLLLVTGFAEEELEVRSRKFLLLP